MQKLVKAGDVSSSWDKGPTKGIVTNSIVSFIVRKGNPKHITTWADLVKPGVQVITPNPFSSGSAKWNLMAAYGAQLAQGKSKAQAQRLPGQAAQEHGRPAVQREQRAADLPGSGQGDVLLDYEDDAIYAKSQGEPISVDHPPQTILIQNPIAVTTKAANPTAAKAFVAYLLSPAGQKVWGQQGYRPVLPSVAAKFKFPKPKSLFTIATLGGWTKVNNDVLRPDNRRGGEDRERSRSVHAEWLTRADIALPRQAAGRGRTRDHRSRVLAPARAHRRSRAGGHLPEPARPAAGGRGR